MAFCWSGVKSPIVWIDPASGKEPYGITYFDKYGGLVLHKVALCPVDLANYAGAIFIDMKAGDIFLLNFDSIDHGTDDGDDWSIKFDIVRTDTETIIGSLTETDDGFGMRLAGENECFPGCLHDAAAHIINYLKSNNKQE